MEEKKKEKIRRDGIYVGESSRSLHHGAVIALQRCQRILQEITHKKALDVQPSGPEFSAKIQDLGDWQVPGCNDKADSRGSNN